MLPDFQMARHKQVCLIICFPRQTRSAQRMKMNFGLWNRDARSLKKDGKSLSLRSLLCAVMWRLIRDMHRENPRENKIIRRYDSFGARREPIIQMVIFLWHIIYVICHANDKRSDLITLKKVKRKQPFILCASWSTAFVMTPDSFAVTGRVHGTPEMCEICHCGETLAQAAKAAQQTSAPV